MKISCPSCSAKYSIADEKVQDRLAKIRCRKCGTTIVIDGKQDPPSVQAADTAAKEEAAPPADAGAEAAAGAYTVDLSDDDQRPMSLEDIVDAYNAGVVSADTYVWKDGMSDWEPLADVAEINAALHAAAEAGLGDDEATSTFSSADVAGGLAAAGVAAAVGSAADDEPTAKPPLAAEKAPADVAAAAGGLASVAASVADPPEAALRSGSGRGSAADLFGSIDMAGGEHDITTSAAGSEAAPTGARNESSVLFSLSALTSAPSADREKSGITEDSGLIDLAALTAGSSPDGAGAPPANLDLGAAPLGAAPLGLGATPLGAGPSPGFSVDARPAQQSGNNNTKFFAFLGAAVLIAVAGFFILKPAPQAPAAPAATVVIAAPPAPQAPPPAAVEPTPAPDSADKKAAADEELAADSKAESEEAKAAAEAAAKATKKPVAHKTVRRTTTKKAAPKKTTTTKKAAPKKTTTKKKAAPKKKKPACNCKPSDLMCAMKCSAK